MPIIWRENMAVGHPVIDHEHKYLICLINAVELAMQVEDSAKVVDFYLDQLMDYTREHFAHEERIQLKFKYPYYAEHKAQHQEILEALDRLKAEMGDILKNRAPTPAATDDAGEEIEVYDPAKEDAPAEKPAPAADKEPAMKDVADFLRHWIIDHVLKSDLKMREYLSRPSPK